MSVFVFVYQLVGDKRSRDRDYYEQRREVIQRGHVADKITERYERRNNIGNVIKRRYGSVACFARGDGVFVVKILVLKAAYIHLQDLFVKNHIHLFGDLEIRKGQITVVIPRLIKLYEQEHAHKDSHEYDDIVKPLFALYGVNEVFEEEYVEKQPREKHRERIEKRRRNARWRYPRYQFKHINVVRYEIAFVLLFFHILSLHCTQCIRAFRICILS